MGIETPIIGNWYLATMNIEVTNELLRRMWTPLKEQLECDVEAQLATLHTAGTYSLSLADGKTTARFDGPPELVQYDEPVGGTTASFEIALPAKSEVAWSLSLRGSISGSLQQLGHPAQLFQNRAFQLELKRLRLGFVLGVNKLDDYPQVTSFDFSLDIDLEVEGFLSIPGPWFRTADGKAYEANVKINLDWLIPGAPTIDGKLRASLLGDDFLTLLPEGIGQLPLGIKVPGAIKAIVAGIRTGNFPPRWGSSETTTLFSEDAPTSFTVAQMAAAANSFRDKQRSMSTPWGTVFDVIRKPTLRSGILVNPEQLVKTLSAPAATDPRNALAKNVWSQIKTLQPALAQRLLTYSLPQHPMPPPDQAAFVSVLHDVTGKINLSVATFIDPLRAAGLVSKETNTSVDIIRRSVANSKEAVAQMNEWILDDAFQEFFDTKSDGSADRYTGDRDSLIWTGHLLAAEAFHYVAINAGPERTATVARINEILNGIGLVFELPSTVANGLPTHVGGGCRDLTPTDPGNFDGLPCRSVVRSDQADRPVFDYANPPTATTNQFYSETQLSDGQRYLAFGRDDDPPSRDQVLGAMLGLSACVKLVNEAGIKQKAGDLIFAFAKYTTDNGWSIPTPKGELFRAPHAPCRIGTFYLGQFLQQLAILWAAASVEAARGNANGPFRQLYDEAVSGFAGIAWVPVWLNTWDPITHYFKFNLDHAAVLILELLDAPGSPGARSLQVLRAALGHHRNPYFNLIFLLSLPPAARLTDISRYKPAPMTTAQETTLLIRQWLTRYNGANGRKATKGPGDLCLQINPDADFLKGLQPAKVSIQPIFGDEVNQQFLPFTALGAHMRPGHDMDFMWQRCSFDLGYVTEMKNQTLHFLRVDEGSPFTVSSGIDFQLAFWMAKWLNCLPDPRVHNNQIANALAPNAAPGAADDTQVRLVAEWLQRFDSFHHKLQQFQFPVANRLRDFAKQRLKDIVGADATNIVIIAHHAAAIANVTPAKAESALKAHLNHDILAVWSKIDFDLLNLLLDGLFLVADAQGGQCRDIVGSLEGSAFGRRSVPQMFGDFSNVRQFVADINDFAQVSDDLPWGNIESLSAGRVSDLIDAMAGRMHL